MARDLDKFGFAIGTKRSEVAELYEQGADQHDMRYRFGGPQINILYDLASRGHKVETYGLGAGGYKVTPNPRHLYSRKIIDLKNLSHEDANDMTMQFVQINPVAFGFRPHKFMGRCLVEGLPYYNPLEDVVQENRLPVNYESKTLQAWERRRLFNESASGWLQNIAIFPIRE